MPRRIAAAISFLIALCAAPPNVSAPDPAPRAGWDLFAGERVLAGLEADALFAPHAGSALLDASAHASLATPEPGSSLLLALGLALLARPPFRVTRASAVLSRRAIPGRRHAANPRPDRRVR